MAENRRSFWTTMPGIISGVAAIVTGLGVLIPLMLGRHNNTNTASQNPTPTATSSTAGGTPTSTGTSGGVSPTASDSSGVSPTASTEVSPGTGVALGLTAEPTSLAFGSVRVNGGTSEMAVTLNNPGTVTVTIDHVEMSPSNPAFTISSTTCGDGAMIAPQGTCQIKVRFAPTIAGASVSASLVIHYHPPASSLTTITLTGSGSLL